METDLEERHSANKRYYRSMFPVHCSSNKPGLLFIVLFHYQTQRKPRTGKISKDMVQSTEKCKNEQGARNSHKRRTLHRDYPWNCGQF